MVYIGISPKQMHMIPFSEWIKINDRPTQFNFRKVYAPNHDKFFISMIDAQKNNISFDMVKSSDGKWNIIKPAPELIMQVKEQLIKIIEKQCALKPLFSFDRSNDFNRVTL